MVETSRIDFDRQSPCLFIHFDVNGHFLSLDTFIRTADSARKVAEALDKTIFEGELRLEIIVLAPREGSFLARLSWLLGGTGTFLLGVGAITEKAISFVESDVGAAYVEGLTGKTPEDWARDLGKSHRKDVQGQFVVATNDEAPTPSVSKPEAHTQEDLVPPDPDSLACGPILQLVGSMTRGILELDSDALVKVGVGLGDLSDALDARAEFYEACYHDPDVKRVGFTPDDDFPIPRNSFPERAQKPERKKKDEEEPEWVVSVEGIFVTSPNWDQEDQKTRQWKGKDAASRDCYFVIEDAEFWFRVKRKGLHVEVLDNLKVQWAHQVVGGKAKNRKVLRVLEFNGEKLADPLTPDAIKAIVGDYTNAEATRNGPSLFDYGDD